MPQVSVIIPVYNGEKYIAQALDSVFAQTFRDFEIIVIDDGSTDGTEAILRHYGDKIVYLKNDHGGPASRLTPCLSVAPGGFTSFLLPTVILFPPKLHRQVSLSSPHLALCVPTTAAAAF